MNLLCPKCLSPLTTVKYHDLRLEVCHDCKGYFIEAKELTNRYLNDFSCDFFQRNAADYNKVNVVIVKCPKCALEMKKMRPILFSPIQVDVCPGCKGVWLEAEENEYIQKVKKNPLTIFRHDSKKMKLIKTATSFFIIAAVIAFIILIFKSFALDPFYSWLSSTFSSDSVLLVCIISAILLCVSLFCLAGTEYTSEIERESHFRRTTMGRDGQSFVLLGQKFWISSTVIWLICFLLSILLYFTKKS